MHPVSQRTVVGRERELTAGDVLLTTVASGVCALVLEGEPGIGKTTTWEAIAGRAHALGHLVVTSRPAQSESRLSFAGLGDIVGGMPQSIVDTIPLPQRHALEIALLKRPAGGAPPDQRAIAVALLSAVRACAATRPLVLAVDDAQWIDQPTAAALEFVVRRLDREPVAVLTSVRIHDGRPVTFDQVVPPGVCTTLRLGPLKIASLQRMIKERLGQSFPRPTLVRIERASRGNPFHALEIARVLADAGDPGPGVALPVPDDLRQLLLARIRRLPAVTRDALLCAAALSEPTTALVEETALEPAIVAELIRIGVDGDVAFVHPLFASAVYEAAAPARRRELHRRLSTQVSDPEERARHLALAATGPDDAVATVLDGASEHARLRGATESAVALKREARRLTPAGLDDARVRRSDELAELLFTAGDTWAAREVLEALVSEAPAGSARNRALGRLGLVRWYDGGWDEGIALCEQALLATTDRVERARLHSQLAWMCSERIPKAAAHARAAVELIDEREQPGLYSEALLNRAEWELKAGHEPDHDGVSHAVLLQDEAARWERSHVPITWPRYCDDFSTSRERCEARLALARAEDDEVFVCEQLFSLGWLDWLTGRPAQADRLIAEAMDLAQRSGNVLFVASLDAMRAQVRTQLGLVNEAQASIESVRELVAEYPSPLFEARCHEAAGFLALSLGDVAVADRAYTSADDLVESTGMHEPADYRFHGDHIEAVLACGDLERATGLCDRLEARGRIFQRPWTLAVGARCRGLVRAAAGDSGAAKTSLEEALEHHRSLEMPFELARTLLCLGRVQRRRRERRAARETLERSIAVFEGLPAPLWAATARTELERIGLRRAPDDLTVNEQRVAELAAGGLTNREIAARLFMSRRTVEANLARAYRKLGIGTRAELGAEMARRA